MKQPTTLLLAFIFLFNSVTTAADPPASPEVAAALQPYLDSYKLPSIIAVIADKTGHVHYQNLMGYSDVEAQKPISTDNVFWIASMSKMFIGAAIMILVDEGKLSLDDPAAQYIPELKNWMIITEKDNDHLLLKPAKTPVTIRHLLSHTSGLSRVSDLQMTVGPDRTTLKGLSLSTVTGPLLFQPGEKYSYGNQGMNIAGRIVEIVTGQPYDQFLQERFFTPLGMTETTFWPNDAQIDRLAGSYGPNKEKTAYAKGEIFFLTKPYSDHEHRYPEAGGGLFSTTHDIFRFGLMLANNGELDGKRYLSLAAMDVLRSKQTGEAVPTNYSLGYFLRNGMFGHDGAYGTDLSVHPQTGLVAIFMTQCTSGDQWAARDQFLKTATEVYNKKVSASAQ